MGSGQEIGQISKASKATQNCVAQFCVASDGPDSVTTGETESERSTGNQLSPSISLSSAS
jgi:hypothetical protein